MNYTKMIEDVNQKTKEYQSIMASARKMNYEILKIRNSISKMESDLLLDFVGFESKIEVDRYTSFRGTQVNIKNTPMVDAGGVKPINIWPCNFYKGDEIEVIKRNKISIVIRCTKKTVGNVAFNPKSEFRISFDGFKEFVFRNSEFYNRFKIWIKRKDSLDSLLG